MLILHSYSRKDLSPTSVIRGIYRTRAFLTSTAASRTLLLEDHVGDPRLEPLEGHDASQGGAVARLRVGGLRNLAKHKEV